MEFERNGNKLGTLIKWHTMEDRPKESGDYLVIWHTPTGTYELNIMAYSKKYDTWGAYDRWSAEELGEHLAIDVRIKEHTLCGWYKIDFTECFEDEGDDF